jgi:hypothetical protein
MAGKMSAQNLRLLRIERERIQAELAKAQGIVSTLQGELRATDKAIAIVEGQEAVAGIPATAPKEARAARGTVKNAVLGLVEEHAENGVKTTDVVAFGRERGIELDRNSVASLLSRLARDGVLSFDESTRRYRPAPRPAAPLRSVS